MNISAIINGLCSCPCERGHSADIRASGAPTAFAEIDTDEELAKQCIKYHPYMRDKMVLTGLLTMTDI